MYHRWGFISALLLLSACAQQPVRESAGQPVKAGKEKIILQAADKKAYNKALWNIKEKKYKKAEATLDKLISKYPDASGPLANKGVIFSKKNQLKKAEEYFLKALSNNNKLVQARNYLAVVYRKQGKFSQAKEMFDAAIATDPYYANAYYNLGILYELYLQVPEKALENYQLYMDLKKGGDKQVAQWVGMLKRQLKAGK